jgi:hypothetical protein
MQTDRRIPQLTSRLPPTPGLWTELSDMVARLRRDLLGGYRPERHYMRGPGPACRAKHGAESLAG